ncbi:MAG: amidohydrolase family protein [Acidimicrobiia bacterium]|nr:amidohydrolase family protein [Acidimicrobiia bacterium]
MSQSFLIRGGCVLSLDPKVGNHPRADVLIENGRVREVGEGLRSREAELVEAADTIVMPGFVDTHRHAWMSLFRNLGAPQSDGLDSSDAGLAHPFEPDDIYAATLIGLLGALEAGITTVVDWSDIAAGDEYADAASQAHADSGVRTVFVHAARANAAHQERGDREASLRRLMTAGPSVSPRTTLAFGSADLVRGNMDRIEGEFALGRSLGLHIHAHAGLRAADQGLLAELAGKKLLGDDVTLVHCSRVSEEDLDGAAAAGASISLNPSTEMAGDLGSPPIQEILNRKIRIGLGVDDERLAPGDIFAQMRAAISVQHATYFDLKLAGKAGLPNLLTTRELIRYATVDGAHVAGVGDTAGTLTPGKQADVIILRTDRPNIFPVNDPIGAVVWGMDTSNIDWVFVGGRALMRNGVLEPDVVRARELAAIAQKRVMASADPLVAKGGEEQP